jgi:hypothetical protein
MFFTAQLLCVSMHGNKWVLFPIRMCHFCPVIFYEAFQFTILIHFQTFYTKQKRTPYVEVMYAHLFMDYCLHINQWQYFLTMFGLLQL